ncbi:hypothetical protein KIH41_05500 [Litoribacter ruber]|uniref:hypothetical protein n=1 Tax=Litoribacter ruber TaxID=702568 RepID=UPI001BD92472|nr:hypothetical protein [Litoribacter ruber]MBT0810731.1 hypothetical protein [Litoribacter ruber]
MFDSPDYPKPLSESDFENWLEEGRNSPMPYSYLLIVWDELEARYIPVYVESREELQSYPKYGSSPERQSLIAAYDIYSESKVG